MKRWIFLLILFFGFLGMAQALEYSMDTSVEIVETPSNDSTETNGNADSLEDFEIEDDANLGFLVSILEDDKSPLEFPPAPGPLPVYLEKHLRPPRA